MMDLLQKFKSLFKKEETTMERMERWGKENAEVQKQNELHEKASKNRTKKKKKKSKPINYNF